MCFICKMNRIFCRSTAFLHSVLNFVKITTHLWAAQWQLPINEPVPDGISITYWTQTRRVYIAAFIYIKFCLRYMCENANSFVYHRAVPIGNIENVLSCHLINNRCSPKAVGFTHPAPIYMQAVLVPDARPHTRSWSTLHQFVGIQFAHQ